jgi:two-component system chemotaxis sensor kinase CheA
VHLLRNAIDHGLEAPDVRERQGKPRRGLLRLTAHREREMLVVETADDGRGISPDRVAETAVARGIISAEAAAALGQAERLMLICDPNFSTAERVTNVSGRGVGLAAVKRQVEALRGELEISSEPGVGTRFRVRLPLTLTIIRALLVGAGGETYAVPFDYIDRVRDVGPGACVLTATGDLLTPEGDRMPVYSLRRLLGVPDAAAAARPASRNARQAYALIASRGMPVALLFDELLGKEEIVVKSLPSILQGIPGLAGATIVGAGDVVLILDVPQLVARLA